MKPIKFRAWDKLENKMRIVTGFSFLPLDGTGTTRIYFLDGKQEVLLKDYPENVAVMQFTGLQDSQEKDIYEGDIISIKPTWSNKTEMGVIEYDYLCRFIMKYPAKDLKKIPTPLHEIIICGFPREVIGNIWENPELLESK